MRRTPLLLRVAVAIAVGLVCGVFLPSGGIRALVTAQALFSQFVKFLVPLIIVAFVTPTIAETGRGAGRLLLLTMGLAYGSTLLAGFFAFGVSSVALPALLHGEPLAAAGAVAREFPAYFSLKIPPPLDVMTALVLSFLVGLAIPAVRAERLLGVLNELKAVVELVLRRAFVPLLPLYVLTVIAELTASERLVRVGARAVVVMGFCLVLSLAVLLLQYAMACLYAKRNPLTALARMLPAYLTGWGTCSSAATIPVTLRQVRACGVSEGTADLVVPLCANVHLAGSMTCLVGYSAGVLALYGDPILFGPYVGYILSMSIVAVAAPGVPGGCILAAGAFVESALGFTPERYALMAALYLALDGLGTSANLTGDGAVALAIDAYRARHPVA